MEGRINPAAVGKAIVWAALLAVLVEAQPVSAAVPARFVPNDSSLILYRFENPPANDALRRARSDAGSDRETAAALAKDYVLRARRDGDPRYYGYAEALLSPWITRGAATPAMQLTWAYLQQHSHRFDAALAVLATVLAAPNPPSEAYLLRASIRVSRGELPLARQDCGALLGKASAVVIAACAAQTATNVASIARSRAILEQLLVTNVDADTMSEARHEEVKATADERAWALGILADLATRAGEPARAEQHFQEALSLVPNDTYLRARYADLLLDQDRAEEVIALVQSSRSDDGLLLRWAIAERSRNHLCAPCDTLAARYVQIQRRSEQPHERDYARFLLHIVGDAPAALKLAQRNWTLQKESADARVLMEAARTLNDSAAAADVRAWLEKNAFYDAVLNDLSKPNAAAGS